jgi:protein-S-isoprenylcysteine O-methyltransferase Ste14
MGSHLIFILRLVAFAMLHSLLALPSIKARIMRITGLNQSAYRLGYNIVALLVFAWVMAADRHSAILYEFSGVARYILYLLQILSLVALAFCLVNTGLMSFLGLNALVVSEKNRVPQQLATHGWYGIVRHPLYFLSILFMFMNPVMSVRWLLLSCLATLYFMIGALIEEKRLEKEFAEEYVRYRKQIPFIVPSLRNVIQGARGVNIQQSIVLFSLFLFSMHPHFANADLGLPVNGPVTSGVGLRIDPFGSGKLVYHRGIDIVVPVGTPVLAVRKGRVVFAGERRGYGGTVIVEHDNGDRTMYGHNSLVRVTPGEVVESGTVVAFSGNTGRSTGPHVHFELRPSGQPVAEQPKKEVTRAQQAMGNSRQRDLYEQQMDETMNSIFKTIGRTVVSGQGG